MSQWITMARPYAKATFEEAKKDGLLQQWSAVLQALSVAVGLRDMIEVINSPKYTDEQVLAILLSVVKAVPACTAELEQAASRLLYLLLENSRLLALEDIAVLFQQSLAQHEGVVTANVQSARQLGDEEVSLVRQFLEKRFKATAQLHFATDPSLIGGVVIQVGSWVMDGSVKNRLARLSDSLRG